MAFFYFLHEVFVKMFHATKILRQKNQAHLRKSSKNKKSQNCTSKLLDRLDLAFPKKSITFADPYFMVVKTVDINRGLIPVLLLTDEGNDLTGKSVKVSKVMNKHGENRNNELKDNPSPPTKKERF